MIEARNHVDVTPDDQRSLVNSRRMEEADATITVVVDWPRSLLDL